MIKVYASVCGDLLHIGHIKYLQQSKALGDYMIVGVLTDEAIATYKRYPIIPFIERFELIGNLKCVDEAVPQNDVDPTENLKKFKPDILTHGDDWGENYPGTDYMRVIGRRAIRTHYYPFQSTTNIIEKIREIYCPPVRVREE